MRICEKRHGDDARGDLTTMHILRGSHDTLYCEIQFLIHSAGVERPNTVNDKREMLEYTSKPIADPEVKEYHEWQISSPSAK